MATEAAANGLADASNGSADFQSHMPGAYASYGAYGMEYAGASAGSVAPTSYGERGGQYYGSSGGAAGGQGNGYVYPGAYGVENQSQFGSNASQTAYDAPGSGAVGAAAGSEYGGESGYTGAEYGGAHYGWEWARNGGTAADGEAAAISPEAPADGADDGGGDQPDASYGTGDAAATNAIAAEAYSWPSDPESTLTMLQQQRQQYRSWVAQCADAALTGLDPLYGNTASSSMPYQDDPRFASIPGAMPDDVPAMLAAMGCAGSVREYLVFLKSAAEAVSEAGRALAAFQAMSLPASVLGASDDPAEVAAGEAAEAEYVSAAYGVTTAVAAAAAQLAALKEQRGGTAGGVVQELLPAVPAGGLEAPLTQKLDRIGAELCTSLRQEAEVLMGRIDWPPPLADVQTDSGAVAASEAGADVPPPADSSGAVSSAGAVAAREGAFAGFEQHPVVARRLVGVLTALTHFQMAVDQRVVFYQLLTGGGDQGQGASEGVADGAEDEGPPVKPLLWAAKALAEPVSAKLRAHFHSAAPTGRLDRPAWLYGTVLEFIRRHGHSLSSLDDMLACLQLKPHYNMPAEFARALQDAVLQQLRDQRIPAVVQLRRSAQEYDNDRDADTSREALEAAEAEADALWLGLMDASAAYDIALLPLLGATGPRIEADAARATALLSKAAVAGAGHSSSSYRQRLCDLLDPTAAGTADMHRHYVAVAAVATGARAVIPLAAGAAAAAAAAAPAGASSSSLPPPTSSSAASSSFLLAWAAAEGATALRTVEAALYDDSSLEPAEEAASRALRGALSGLDDDSTTTTTTDSFNRGGRTYGGGATPEEVLRGGGGAAAAAAAAGAPWQRDTWPSAMAREVAGVLDGLAARSRWLSASPTAQRDFLQAAAGPVLAAVRQRLARLMDQAVTRGDVLSEEGLPKACAALCAAHFLHDHLHSLLLTELAPLVHALEAAAATSSTTADGFIFSGPGTPTSSVAAGGGAVGGGVPAGKLGGGGGGGGGFWSGLLSTGAPSGGGNAVPASPARLALRDGVTALAAVSGGSVAGSAAVGGGGAAPGASVLGEYVTAFAKFHRDGCLKVSRELALGFGRHSVLYRQAIEVNPQFPFTPEEDEEPQQQQEDCSAAPATSITPAFAPALLFLQTTLQRLSRCCDKATFADVWRGAALSINRFMFNFIATESRFTRAGARQFAADVAGLAQLFAPYSMRRVGGGGLASSTAGGSTDALVATTFASSGPGSRSRARGNQHFRELQAAARLLCLGDEEAADVMRRASAAAVAAQAAAAAAAAAATAAHRGPSASASPARRPGTLLPHARGDPVRAGMAADLVLSSGGLACLSPLQIMNVIEHRI